MLDMQLKLVEFSKHALVGVWVLPLERLLAWHLVTGVVGDAI